MGRTCRGICAMHKADSVSNKIRYDIGHKRCTFCGIFMDLIDVRCICCKAVLRTKPRGKNKKRKNISSFNSAEKLALVGISSSG